VAKTPEQLPMLREAGVVDSGGLGLSVTLEGALKHLHGEPLPVTVEDAGQIDQEWLAGVDQAHGADGERFGYCVEFVVRGPDLAAGELRAGLEQIGSSVLVVGGGDLVRVHVHAADPGAALSRGVALGSLTRVKVDNMSEQARRLAERAATAPAVAAGPFSVVAVAAGAGLAGTLRRVGAERVVAGGQTMNPSTRELIAAIEGASLPHVVLLPNNKNIIWTAEQAAKLSKKTVDVIPTRTVPQGIAALIALNPEDEPAAGLQAMRDAVGQVRTVEVTRAARRARIDGRPVDEGQPIALVDDELCTTAATPEDAAIAAIERVDPGEAPLLTMYYGASVTADAAERFGAALRETFPGAEVEVLMGGQPFYEYVISVE
jgi:DAK2 domain fusion protein YloV